MSDQTNNDAGGYVDPTTAASEHFASIREDATKAVEEALKAEQPEPKTPAEDPEAPDEPAAAKGKLEEAEESEPAADEEKAAPAAEDKSIARILKQREQAAKAKTEAQRALEESRAAIEEARTAREELAKEREEIAREKAKLAKLKNVQEAPEALKELGWDPDDFIASAARANTPEGKLEALVRKQAETIAKLEAKANGWEEEREQQKVSAQKQAETARIQQAEETFSKIALDATKYPALANLYEDERDVLLFKAHSVARQYRAATGGEEATFEQIADYLNEQAQAKLGNGAKKQDAPKNGKAPPAGRPTGKRTLTGADGSERRSVAAVDKTDDLDEMRRRARAAAEKAIRESA